MADPPGPVQDLIRVGGSVLLSVGIIGALLCGRRRFQASFADAHMAEGVTTQVTKVYPSDDNTFYYELAVTTAARGRATIRRVCTMGGQHPCPEIGQLLRFRHLTRDPDERDDALLESVGLS